MAGYIRGRVVEIGAGIGTFSDLLRSASSEPVLVEPGTDTSMRRYGINSVVRTASR